MGLIQYVSSLFQRTNNRFFENNANFRIGQVGPVWMDTDKPRELYEQIPQLYIPVNKLSAMFSNAVIKVLNDKGEDVGTDEFYKLIANPNFSQSMNEWLNNFLTQKLVYGNTFMYKNMPSALSKMPFSLWNLSPSFVTPILTGKAFDQLNMEGVISKYKYQIAQDIKFYESNTILYTKITDIDNPFIGRSPLMSLRFPLSNTKLAYEYRNVIMGKRGAIGVLSPEGAKDSMGAVPFLSSHRKDIVDQHLSTFGVQDGKSPLIISDVPMKWMPMTFPTRDLLLFEEIDANFMTILDTLGVNRNIFKDSTFENQKSGLVQTYEDTIFPHADQLAQDLTKFLNIKVGKITFDYSHLSILQADNSKIAETFGKQVASVVQLYEKNIVNKEGAVQMLIKLSGIEFVAKSEDTIDILNRLSALVSNKILDQMLVDEIRALISAPKIANGDLRASEFPKPAF